MIIPFCSTHFHFFAFLLHGFFLFSFSPLGLSLAGWSITCGTHLRIAPLFYFPYLSLYGAPSEYPFSLFLFGARFPIEFLALPTTAYPSAYRNFVKLPFATVSELSAQSLLGFRPFLVRNHHFSYPPYHFFFRRIPTALCRTPFGDSICPSVLSPYF